MMTRCEKYWQMQDEQSADYARKVNNLPPILKIRSCLRCSTSFESRGPRFCKKCTQYNNQLSYTHWEPQLVGRKRTSKCSHEYEPSYFDADK